MYKKTVIFFLFMLLMQAGCTRDKALQDRVANLEKELENIKKMLVPPEEEEAVQAQAYVLPVGQSHVLGEKNAPVNIVVFSNYQCPHCATADKNLREIIKDPELAKKVNLVFKHFPFERLPDSKAAAKAALAAGEQGNDKFWSMTEKIFANQANLNEQSYVKWASEIAIDVAKFKADLASNGPKYEAMIKEDINLGTNVAQVQGTPWVVIGGWQYDGRITLPEIKKFIADKKL